MDVSRLKVESKGLNDYVTSVDFAAERAILDVLKQAYPEHCFLSEEAGEIKGDEDRHLWVIDPLDGTRNFIHGLPHYAISIAKLYRGKVEHAVIYNPITEDLYTASIGDGALLNSKRIRVKDRKSLQGGLFSTSITRVQDNIDAQLGCLKALQSEHATMRHCGSTALDLAYVASGVIDTMWAFNCPIWDIAAGSLILREAGGSIMETDGGVKYLESGNLVAGGPTTTKQMVKLLRQHFKT